jgi:AcrR family transcriptional regulator
MTTAYHRKKQPELVRRQLLDCAMRLALEHGPAGITVQGVSEAAGVTRGGLFHHFPSRQALVEGVYADMVAKTDADIDALMAEDPRPRGSFTRAYVQAVFADPALDQGGRGAVLYISALSEPTVRRMWADWFKHRLERHRDTDDTPALETVRLAADGAWLAHLMRGDGGPVPDLAALRERLIAATLLE